MSAGPVESGGGGGGRRGRTDTSQDFELNIASIIDCFVVLITFMLASASFLSLGILDAGIAAAGSSATPGTPPPVNVVIELRENRDLVVKVTGKQNTTTTLQAKTAEKGREWNYENLTVQLAGLKLNFPAVTGATLVADNKVEYKEVVKSMEVVRKSLPVVLLGGF
jgi:biopolymer transport protein ExbD